VEARFQKAYCHLVTREKAIALREYQYIANNAASSCHKQIASAMILFVEGDASKCLHEMEKVAKKYPNSSMALYYLGDAHRIEGNWANAEENYRKSVESAEDGWPMIPWIQTMRGEALYELGKHMNSKEASDKINEAILVFKQCDKVTMAHVGLSKCFKRKSDLKSALHHLIIANKLNPILVPDTKVSKHAKLEDDSRRCTAQQQSLGGNVITSRGPGPSGKGKIHNIDKSSKKEAYEAAKQAGQGKPEKHIPDYPELPHYHPTDKNGEIIKNGAHYTYPR